MALVGVPATNASGTPFVLRSSPLEGVPADSMSKILSTAPSFCGVGPNALRTQAGVGSSSGTGASSCGFRPPSFCLLLLGVAAMALADRSLKALRSASFGVDLVVFRGVVCCFFVPLRLLLYSLYFATVPTYQHATSVCLDQNYTRIVAFFLMSSLEGLRPPFAFAKSFSHFFNSTRSSSGALCCNCASLDIVTLLRRIQAVVMVKVWTVVKLDANRVWTRRRRVTHVRQSGASNRPSVSLQTSPSICSNNLTYVIQTLNATILQELL